MKAKVSNKISDWRLHPDDPVFRETKDSKRWKKRSTKKVKIKKSEKIPF